MVKFVNPPILSAKEAYKLFKEPVSDVKKKKGKGNQVKSQNGIKKHKNLKHSQNGIKKHKNLKHSQNGISKEKILKMSPALLNEAKPNLKKVEKKKETVETSSMTSDILSKGFKIFETSSPNVTIQKLDNMSKLEAKIKSVLDTKGGIKKKKSKSLTKKMKTKFLCESQIIKKQIAAENRKVKDSKKLGEESFKWLLGSLTPKEFFQTYWEKKELLIRAGENGNRFKGILSTLDIDKILRKHSVTFTKNIDVTSYKDGVRETHNPEGRALAPLVWDYYNSGCSIRMLNPQTFHRPVWKLLASLQEYFNSFCGANVYLTPPGTQGFAPHWDDIEAFILQLEGKKQWKVYRPRTANEALPRESSPNFGPNTSLGDPVLDCVLNPGDLLYFPRGFIHQGHALDDQHSLHITLSTYQKNAWVDLLETLLPAALATAAEEDVEFRRGLPREYLHHTGIVHSTQEGNDVQRKMAAKVNDLVQRMMKNAPIDLAVDQMAKKFIHDSLPPVLSEAELVKSVFEGGERWSSSQDAVENRVELGPESSIRMLRKGCARLVVEEDSVRLFHSLENSREYHAEEPKYVEIAPEMAFAMETLIRAYPRYTLVEKLPLKTMEDKTALAIGLWEKGLVVTKEELIAYDDSGVVSVEH